MSESATLLEVRYLSMRTHDGQKHSIQHVLNWNQSIHYDESIQLFTLLLLIVNSSIYVLYI